jgi:anti-sigma factor (TIGR02949 family)
MRCREVVELMTEYLEGALSHAERMRFEQHIEGCDGCRAYLEQLRRTRDVLGKVGEEPVPAHLRSELMKAFRNWRAS